MDTLKNYVPNLYDLKYNSNLHEYKLMLSVNLSPSYESQTDISFGSVLSIIDYCFEVKKNIFKLN